MLRAVAPHLGGDQGVHLAVPHPERHVDVVVVEGDPRLGAFGGGLAAVGLDLDEVGNRAHVAIERLVERAVDAQRLADANGANGRAAFSVAGDDLRRNRLGRRVRDEWLTLREEGAAAATGAEPSDADCAAASCGEGQSAATVRSNTGDSNAPVRRSVCCSLVPGAHMVYQCSSRSAGRLYFTFFMR